MGLGWLGPAPHCRAADLPRVLVIVQAVIRQLPSACLGNGVCWVLLISHVCILNMPWLFTCDCICDVMGAIKGSREILSRIVNSGVRKITPLGMSSQLIVFGGFFFFFNLAIHFGNTKKSEPEEISAILKKWKRLNNDF